MLKPPKIAPEIPEKGFKDVRDIYVAPANDPDSVEVIINKDSDRLQKLQPFPKMEWQGFREITNISKSKWKVYNRPYFTSRTLVNVQRTFRQDK